MPNSWAFSTSLGRLFHSDMPRDYKFPKAFSVILLLYTSFSGMSFQTPNNTKWFIPSVSRDWTHTSSIFLTSMALLWNLTILSTGEKKKHLKDLQHLRVIQRLFFIPHCDFWRDLLWTGNQERTFTTALALSPSQPHQPPSSGSTGGISKHVKPSPARSTFPLMSGD